ncbi:MAG: metal-dependent hydrolase [Lachnospiraceae bacterium]|nr:metal-dependent hydrolase [Lachnospiraceae bacterium]
MLGKTHMVIGTAAALAITRPKTVGSLVICLGASALGALISDIDVGTSESHKDADIVVTLAAGIAMLTAAAEYLFHLDLYRRIFQNTSKLPMIAGILLFLVICAFGKEQPHRSFMHSFLALILLAACIYLVIPQAVPYFAIGFLSHIAIDLFNRRKVRLLYPFSGGFSLGLFPAHGTANHIFFLLGSVLTAAEILLCVPAILF